MSKMITLWQQPKTASGKYGNPTEIHTIRKDQFRVVRSLKLGGNEWLVLVNLQGYQDSVQFFILVHCMATFSMKLFAKS